MEHEYIVCCSAKSTIFNSLVNDQPYILVFFSCSRNILTPQTEVGQYLFFQPPIISPFLNIFCIFDAVYCFITATVDALQALFTMQSNFQILEETALPLMTAKIFHFLIATCSIRMSRKRICLIYLYIYIYINSA